MLLDVIACMFVFTSTSLMLTELVCYQTNSDFYEGKWNVYLSMACESEKGDAGLEGDFHY